MKYYIANITLGDFSGYEGYYDEGYDKEKCPHYEITIFRAKNKEELIKLINEVYKNSYGPYDVYLGKISKMDIWAEFEWTDEDNDNIKNIIELSQWNIDNEQIARASYYYDETREFIGHVNYDEENKSLWIR